MAIQWIKRKQKSSTHISWVGKMNGESAVRYRVFYQPRNKIWAVDAMTYHPRSGWSKMARTERLGYGQTDREAMELADTIVALM